MGDQGDDSLVPAAGIPSGTPASPATCPCSDASAASTPTGRVADHKPKPRGQSASWEDKLRARSGASSGEGPARERVLANPALRNLSYRWAVHRAGRDPRPGKPQAAWLAVCRDRQEAARFTLLNPASSRLLDEPSRESMTGESAIWQLANELGHADAGQLLARGG